ncbi:early endosome antigen 1 isoform X2 [Polypterus senegalus]|uniref:early endosome antigen 1 isoform X2 n=1 Tax=Polypterus senegalus TaxID=55291 RepID=UPI0019668C45|nr:early endosome antigen 1 isoform X2 [Polypterus senegalus]
MLRRILQRTPGKGGSQSSDIDQTASDVNNEESSEGFICPYCICSYQTPSELFDHYEHEHGEGDTKTKEQQNSLPDIAGFICPQCMKSHVSAEELFRHYEAFHSTDNQSGVGSANLSLGRDDLSLLRQEVQDLQASLKEERWFSGELKKELEKVQGQLKQAPPTDGVTSSTELQTLEFRLQEAEAETFNIKQMKDLFEQKAAQLATEIVDIKSKYDEEKSLREASDQQIKTLSHELQQERAEKENLKTELLQRPGVEDVDVLKKELVQVQTLMDKMTREREEESERLKNELQNELSKGPKEIALYTKQLNKLQTSLNDLEHEKQSALEKLAKKEQQYKDLEERLNEELASKKSLQSIIHQNELNIRQLEAQLASAEASTQRLQSELSEKGEVKQRLKGELSEVELKYQQLKAEFKQLQQQKEERELQSLQQQSEINQLHAKLLETERQLGEVQGRLKEQRQLSGEKLKDKEQLVADLQLKLSRTEEQLKENTVNSSELQHQLDKARQQHQELQTLQQTTTSKLREAQNDLEQVLRQIGDKDQKIQNLEALLQKSKDNITQLEAERDDLCLKIQAGEGETAVLNQLQEKNHTLQEQVTQLTDKLKNQSESHKQAQENLHEQVQEQKALLRTSQDRCLTLESSISELNGQLTEYKEKVTQLDSQLKAKTELLLSSEASKAAQRADLQNHLETAQHALQDKQQELVKTKTQLDEISARLQDKLEYISQLEVSLKDHKEKLLNSEQRTEQLEGKIKKFEADAQKTRTNLEQCQLDLSKQKQLCLESEKQVKELGKFLEEEKIMLTNAKSDHQKASVNLIEAKQKLACLEEEKQSLEKEKDNLKKVHEDLENQCRTLTESLGKAQERNVLLSKELATMNENLTNTTQVLAESKSQLEKERQLGKAALKEKEKSHEQFAKDLQKKAEATATEVIELKTLLERNAEMEKELKSQIAGITAELSKTQDQLKAKEEEEQQLYAKLKESQESAVQEKKKLETQLSVMQSNMSEKTAIENKLNSQLLTAAENLKAEKEKSSEIERHFKSVKESLTKLQSDLYGKESELSATRQDLKATEEKLVLAQEEMVTNRTQLSNLNQQIVVSKEEKITLEKDLITKDEQIKQNEKSLQDEQKEKALKEQELKKEIGKVLELTELKSRLEKDFSKISEELRKNKEHSEKELNDLTNAKQLLIDQKLEIQGQVDNLKSTLEQEKKIRQAAEEAFVKKENDMKKDLAIKENKLSTELKAKEEQKKHHEEAEVKLNMQIAALNENIAVLKKDWQSSQRRVGELEKQTDELRGEIAVLEATVQNNQDERRVLLERCLKSEGEIEKLQNKNAEMRRKLDDTTAAMQELGRENQTLQIKHTQALTRKWTEDHEVQNCMCCGKGFSVTIRKHHCRHCGNIFCAECSARNALIPSSKKPVRVCNTCFEELRG